MLAGRLLPTTGHARRALDLTRARRDRGALAQVYHLLGEIGTHSQPLEMEASAAHYQHAPRLAHELGMRPLQAHCHRGLGTLYGQIEMEAQACAELSTAIDMYRAMEMTFWLLETEAALADVER